MYNLFFLLIHKLEVYLILFTPVRNFSLVYQILKLTIYRLSHREHFVFSVAFLVV